MDVSVCVRFAKTVRVCLCVYMFFFENMRVCM